MQKLVLFIAVLLLSVQGLINVTSITKNIANIDFTSGDVDIELKIILTSDHPLALVSLECINNSGDIIYKKVNEELNQLDYPAGTIIYYERYTVSDWIEDGDVTWQNIIFRNEAGETYQHGTSIVFVASNSQGPNAPTIDTVEFIDSSNNSQDTTGSITLNSNKVYSLKFTVTSNAPIVGIEFEIQTPEGYIYQSDSELTTPVATANPNEYTITKSVAFPPCVTVGTYTLANVVVQNQGRFSATHADKEFEVTATACLQSEASVEILGAQAKSTNIYGNGYTKIILAVDSTSKIVEFTTRITHPDEKKTEEIYKVRDIFGTLSPGKFGDYSIEYTDATGAVQTETFDKNVWIYEIQVNISAFMQRGLYTFDQMTVKNYQGIESLIVGKKVFIGAYIPQTPNAFIKIAIKTMDEEHLKAHLEKEIAQQYFLEDSTKFSAVLTNEDVNFFVEIVLGVERIASILNLQQSATLINDYYTNVDIGDTNIDSEPLEIPDATYDPYFVPPEETVIDNNMSQILGFCQVMGVLLISLFVL